MHDSIGADNIQHSTIVEDEGLPHVNGSSGIAIFNLLAITDFLIGFATWTMEMNRGKGRDPAMQRGEGDEVGAHHR